VGNVSSVRQISCKLVGLYKGQLRVDRERLSIKNKLNNRL